MSIRKPALLAVIAALGLLILGAVSASAHTALRTDPGNLPLSGSTTITNTTSDHFTFASTSGTITCTTASFDLDVNTHTGSPSITGKLTAFTATGCSDTIPLINITSCHLHPFQVPTVHITADRDTGGVFSFTDLIIRCGIQGSALACYYTSANAQGQYNNATASLHFLNVAASWVMTGDGEATPPCPNAGVWSVTFTHVVQGGTNRTITVTTT